MSNSNNFDGLSGLLSRHATCQHCRQTSTLSKCTACRRVVYCSTQCQRSDWPLFHKSSCKKLQALQATISDLPIPHAHDFVLQSSCRQLYIQTQYQLVVTLMNMAVVSQKQWRQILELSLDLLRINPGDDIGIRKLVPYTLLWLNETDMLYEFIAYWWNRELEYETSRSEWIHTLSFSRYLETRANHYLPHVRAKQGDWIYGSNNVTSNSVNETISLLLQSTDPPLYLVLPIILDKLAHSTAYAWRHAKYHYWQQSYSQRLPLDLLRYDIRGYVLGNAVCLTEKRRVEQAWRNAVGQNPTLLMDLQSVNESKCNDAVLTQVYTLCQRIPGAWNWITREG